MDFIAGYEIAVVVIGLVGLLQFIQLLVADAAGIGSKKTPGFPAQPDHNSFAFRSERAFLNTNESVTIFLLFTLFSILSAANPFWLNVLSTTYAVSRLLHMFFYYFDVKLARSGVFVISLIALAGLFIVGAAQWL